MEGNFIKTIDMYNYGNDLKYSLWVICSQWIIENHRKIEMSRKKLEMSNMIIEKERKKEINNNKFDKISVCYNEEIM